MYVCMYVCVCMYAHVSPLVVIFFEWQLVIVEGLPPSELEQLRLLPHSLLYRKKYVCMYVCIKYVCACKTFLFRSIIMRVWSSGMLGWAGMCMYGAPSSSHSHSGGPALHHRGGGWPLCVIKAAEYYIHYQPV